MTDRNQNWQLAECYIAGNIPADELTALHNRLHTDPIFAADFEECLSVLQSLSDSGKQQRFRSMLATISKEQKATETSPAKKEIRVIPLRTHYWRTAGIAAGIALMTTLSTFWMTKHSQKKTTDQYDRLRREMATIKTSQKNIINKVNQQNAAPALPAAYTGTGFAITNDGYVITNYHVTEGADSVYIQDSKGGYYKASVVSFDAKNDVALLKVANENFSFGKGDVPYTLASGKKGLGSRVYTLGFPQDEVVYNEGYISAHNGFLGDSMQYQLELPASFGQSGAPVMDAQGNVIGIVTARQGDAGATFAVSSKAIYSLLNNLSKEVTLNLPHANKLNKLKREQQVEKLEPYTCSVQVFKKQ